MTGAPARRAMAGWAAGPVLMLMLLLSACAAVPRGAGGAAGGALSGRLTMRVEPAGSAAAARSVSAAFELSGDAQRGELALSTPLGTLLALARWQPGSVTLATPQGESRHADLDALTRSALGEPLPVAAMFDWLRGRPWPDAQSVPAQPPADAGFSQLGWAVDLSQFADSLVVARRLQEPPVTVRVKLDRP